MYDKHAKISDPQTPRRKGKDAITIRTNGGGTTITWKGQTVPVDDMTDEMRERIAQNISNERGVG